MKVIVTCGPASEPIDEVRRISNFSTGKLGVLLSTELVRSGHQVFCFKGHGAVYPSPGSECHVAQFTTNPKGLVVAALTTAGYAGMLMGPAAIGFSSREIGLHSAFWFLAALLACVPIFGKYVTVEKPSLNEAAGQSL
jgi:hypothetical protein